MDITRTQVIDALEALGVDPTTTDEVMIFPDKVVVRQRAIMMVTDPEEHSHNGDTHTH